MGAVALIEFKDPAGRTRLARWMGSELAYEAPIFFDSLDHMLSGAGSEPLTPLSQFYDHSLANGEEDAAAKWLPVRDGTRTLDALIRSLDGFAPGQAEFSPGETVAGIPAEDVYTSLKQMRTALAEAAERGEPMFRFLVYN
jgi:hypothetical protein